VGRAAVDAFKAGNDMLLIPADLEGSYGAVLAAVRSGEITTSRLDQSVLKILEAKAALGLHKARLVDLEVLDAIVAKPENQILGQQISDDAVTLVRDSGKLLPLKPSGTAVARLPYQKAMEVRNDTVAVIFTEDVRQDTGSVLERQIRSRVPDADILYVDTRIASAMTEGVLDAVDHARTAIVAVYSVPTAGKQVKGPNGLTNSVGVSDASRVLLEKILDRGAGKTVMLAMGNPYLAQDFPSVENYLCTFSNAPVSEVSAVKALFGEIPIRGHLPVTIPNIAERGAGIERPGQVAEGGARVHP